MKSATIGLALGAINIATAKASLFEEDFELANYDENFDTDLADITDFDDDFADSEGRNLQMFEEPEDEEPEEEESSGRNRRNRRRGRGRGRGRGRNNRKNKRKNRKNKEPFNFQEKMQKLAENQQKKDQKLPQKCDKKKARGEKVCGLVDEKDKERCGKWIESQHVKCMVQGKCRNQQKFAKKSCGLMFKQSMIGIWKDDVESDFASQDVGSCFQGVLDNANQCAKNAKESIAAAMEGFEPPTEEEIAAFKAAMKQARQSKRKNRKGNRNNKRKRTSNKAWRQKKQWQQKKQNWENEAEEEIDEQIMENDYEMEGDDLN